MDFELGCEECGIENESLLDTILENKPTRLCEKCARNSGALILNEEKGKVREKWNYRNAKKPEQTYGEEPKVTLQGLWDRYNQKMGERNTLEKNKKLAVLDEKKFLEDLERQKKLDNQQIVAAIDSEFNSEGKIENEKSFNEEASKRLDIRGFFKQTFKFLKAKEKVESAHEEGDIPEMVPENLESLEERKNED